MGSGRACELTIHYYRCRDHRTPVGMQGFQISAEDLSEAVRIGLPIVFWRSDTWMLRSTIAALVIRARVGVCSTMLPFENSQE